MIDLKKRIIDHLATANEATAKQLSAALHEEQFDVVKELNELHKTAQVEREKRAGKGNEYIYWITTTKQRADDVPPDADASLLAAANALLSERIHRLLDALGISDNDEEGINVAVAMIHELCDALCDAGLRVDELRARISQLEGDLEQAQAALVGVAQVDATPTAQPVPRRPYSATEITGYRADGNLLTLFFKRSLSSHAVTVDADRLRKFIELAA